MSRALLAVEMWKKCSTCRSQNGTKTTCSDHFWKLRCSKSARRCGVKHIFSQNEKTHHVRTTFGRSNGTTQHNNKQKRKIQQQQPTTNNQQPTTNNQQPTTNNQPTQKSTTPTTFRSISGFALPSMHHSNSPLPLFSIFETSATALCGATGIIFC